MKLSFIGGCITVVLGILSLTDDDFYPTKFPFLYLGIIIAAVLVDDMIEVAVDKIKNWFKAHGKVRNRYLHV